MANNYLPLSILVGLCTISGSCAADESCLVEQWSELALVDQEVNQVFDRRHDISLNGERFSCNVYVTPSEVKSMLDQLHQLARNDSTEQLAELVGFPVEVFSDTTFVNDKGQVQFQSVVYRDKTSLVKGIGEVLPRSLKNILTCARIDNVGVDTVNGFELGYGSIWINRTLESRALKVVSFSINPQLASKWVDQNCS